MYAGAAQRKGSGGTAHAQPEFCNVLVAHGLPIAR